MINELAVRMQLLSARRVSCGGVGAGLYMFDESRNTSKPHPSRSTASRRLLQVCCSALVPLSGSVLGAKVLPRPFLHDV